MGVDGVTLRLNAGVRTNVQRERFARVTNFGVTAAQMMVGVTTTGMMVRGW